MGVRRRTRIAKIVNQTHLLMIHGLLGSIDYFAPRSYLTGLHVHTPDLLGYGPQGGAVPAAAIDLHVQADTIAQNIRQRIGAPTWLLVSIPSINATTHLKARPLLRNKRPPIACYAQVRS
jgi:pimeloyl-ACP methyl ester carboxylesterase